MPAFPRIPSEKWPLAYCSSTRKTELPSGFSEPTPCEFFNIPVDPDSTALCSHQELKSLNLPWAVNGRRSDVSIHNEYMYVFSHVCKTRFCTVGRTYIRVPPQLQGETVSVRVLVFVALTNRFVYYYSSACTESVGHTRRESTWKTHLDCRERTPHLHSRERPVAEQCAANL